MNVEMPRAAAVQDAAERLAPAAVISVGVSMLCNVEVVRDVDKWWRGSIYES